jgi:hypothetical protein
MAAVLRFPDALFEGLELGSIAIEVVQRVAA